MHDRRILKPFSVLASAVDWLAPTLHISLSRLTASQKTPPLIATTYSDKRRRFLAACALFNGAHAAEECRQVNPKRRDFPGILLWLAVKRNEECG